MREHYTTLNIKEGSTLKEIKKASRRLLLKHHPDLHPNNQQWAQEKTKKILHAYNILIENHSEQVSFRTTEDFKQEAQQPKQQTSVPLMYFALGDLLFAVPILNVKYIDILEALKITKITSKTGLYPFIIGIISTKDSIAPLLDIGSKLSIEKSELKHQVLICELEGQSIALIIDEGKGVLTVSTNDYYNQQHKDQSLIPDQYITNVIKHNDQYVHILNIGNILTK